MRIQYGLCAVTLLACSNSDVEPGSASDFGSGTSAASGAAQAGASMSAPSTLPSQAGASPSETGGSVPARRVQDAGSLPNMGGSGSRNPVDSDNDGGVSDPRAGADAAGAGDAGSAAAGSGGQRGTGPGDWGPGDYPEGLTEQTYLEIQGVPGQNGMTRQYKVHVPPSYDPNVPTPLVFCIHGLGQDSVLFCVNGADMPAKSDQAGFVLVMPNGYQNSWNGGTCCGAAADEQLDDVALMRAIFDEVATHVNVDTSRVYATGLSNGGYMSYRLACEASDLFTATAPGAGAVGVAEIGGGTRSDGDWTACNPGSKISVLDIHGTSDGLINYALQKPSIERIAEANGCDLTTEPAAQPVSQGDTSCVSYMGCPDGVEVIACSVDGGGHVWFGNQTCGTGVEAACAIVGNNSDDITNTDAVWEFFSRHSR